MQHYERIVDADLIHLLFPVARFSVIKMHIIPRMTYQFKGLLLFFRKLTTANYLSFLTVLIC